MDVTFILAGNSAVNPHTGALMNISLSYKHLPVRDAVEQEVARYMGKIGKLLQSYQPDMIQLHGAFEKHPRKEAYSFSLNLSLPTGTLHATGEGTLMRLSVKDAFAELTSQIKKHQAKLRRDYEWKKRKRLPATALV
jgi:ribosome-associated translation inhibitor RaiA